MSAAKRIRIASVDSTSVHPRQLDWNKCCLCQLDTNEELTSPTNNKDKKRVDESYKSLSETLMALKYYDDLPPNLDLDLLNEGQGLKATLLSRNAMWHRSCRLRFTSTRIRRLEKRKSSLPAPPSPPPAPQTSTTFTRSSSTTPKDLKQYVCFLCTKTDVAEKLTNVMTLEAADTMRKWAWELKKFELAGLLQGDLIALEGKYHKLCHTQLFNEYMRSLTAKSKPTTQNVAESEHLCSVMAFEYIAQLIRDKLHSNGAQYVFKMPSLISAYKRNLEILLGREASSQEVHSTRLRQRILCTFPQLQAHKSGREYILVQTGTNVHQDFISEVEDVTDGDAASYFKLTRSLRREIAKVSCSFSGSFEGECQEASVPPVLIAVLNLLLYGSTNNQTDTKQPVLTIAQLLILNFRLRVRDGRNSRTRREQGAPLPMYLALSAYSNNRSSKSVDDMHQLGLSISYKRLHRTISGLCQLQSERAKEEGLVCPSNLKKDLFTIGAYDNIDHNPTSTTSKESFHGTSISIFQCRAENNLGTKREFHSTFNDVDLRSTRIPELLYSFSTVKPKFLHNKNPPLPKCTEELANDLTKGLTIDSVYTKELDWLKHADEIVNTETNGSECLDVIPDNNNQSLDVSWAAFHASRHHGSIVEDIQALLPLFYESSSSISMICHGMNIIKSTTSFLNPGQIPVMAVDQPLFALCKIIQWNWPELYGENKFVVIFGHFHVEQGFLKVLGKLLDNSGWSTLVAKSGISSESTVDSILKVTHVKKARMFHEFTALTLYSLLNEAYNSNSPQVTLEEWVKEQCVKVPTFQFWMIILNLETLLLSFVRSLRERNYTLFKECLKLMLPWFFLMDHIHYARWLSVHLKDLEELPIHSPDTHAEFSRGNFAIQKSCNPFSAIAVDQAHEQHNKNIKGDGGTVGLFNDPAALHKWAIAGPEIQRLINEFKSQENEHQSKTHKHLHHEQYPAFQNEFMSNVNKLKDSFMAAGNPFQETSDELISLDTRVVSDEECVKMLRDSEARGILLYKTFVSERLSEGSKTNIFAPLKSNKIRIFNQMKKKRNTDKEMVHSLQNDVHLFQRCLTVSMNRKLDMENFFKHENSTYPPSLSSNGHLRHALGKADILQPLEKLMNLERNTFSDRCDVVVCDGAALIHATPPRNSRTFEGYCSQEFQRTITGMIESCSADRIDVVWDLYFPDSLKNSLREVRGKSQRLQVTPNSPVPRNWSEFLKNNHNKEELFSLLGKYLIENVKNVRVVTNIGTKYASSESNTSFLEGLDCSAFEEADGRIILHIRDAVLQGAKKVLVRTVDTDVAVLAISFYYELKNYGLEELFVSLNYGKKQRFFAAHEIAVNLGTEKSVALRGFHAFSGCDTVSTFAFHGKQTAWKTWNSCDYVTSAFVAISKPLPELGDELLRDLEQFVVYMYSKSSTGMTLDKTRQHLSQYEEKPFDRLPPTSEALRQHALRAAYQGGHIWGQCMDPLAEIPSPDGWGWIKEDSEWVANWTCLPTIWKGCRDLVKCKCKTGCSSTSNCSCKRSNVDCVPVLCSNCNGCSNMSQ